MQCSSTVLATNLRIKAVRLPSQYFLGLPANSVPSKCTEMCLHASAFLYAVASRAKTMAGLAAARTLAPSTRAPEQRPHIYTRARP